MDNLSKINQIKLYALPSWISNLVSIVILFIVVAGTFLGVIFKNKTFNQLFQNGSLQSKSSNDYKNLLINIDKIPVIRDLPIFIFWGGVGIIIYIMAKKIIESVTNIEHVKESMNYVNARSQDVFFTYLTSILIRLAGLAMLIGLVYVFIELLIPRLIVQTKITAKLGSVHNILFLVIYCVFLMVIINLITISLRLFFLRGRLINAMEEEIILSDSNLNKL